MFRIVLDGKEQQHVLFSWNTKETKHTLTLEYVWRLEDAIPLSEVEQQTWVELHNPWIRAFAKNPFELVRFAKEKPGIGFKGNRRESSITRVKFCFDREQHVPQGRFFRTLVSGGFCELWITDPSGNCVSANGSHFLLKHMQSDRSICIVPEHLQRPVSDDEFRWIQQRAHPHFQWVDYPVRPALPATNLLLFLRSIEASWSRKSRLHDRNVYRHILQFAIPPPLHLSLSTHLAGNAEYQPRADWPFLWSNGTIMSTPVVCHPKTRQTINVVCDTSPIVFDDSIFFTDQCRLHMIDHRGNATSVPLLSTARHVVANDRFVAVRLEGGFNTLLYAALFRYHSDPEPQLTFYNAFRFPFRNASNGRRCLFRSAIALHPYAPLVAAASHEFTAVMTFEGQVILQCRNPHYCVGAMIFDPIREVLMQLSEDHSYRRQLTVIPLNGSDPYTVQLQDYNDVFDSYDFQMMFTQEYSRLVIRGDGKTNVYMLSRTQGKKRLRLH